MSIGRVVLRHALAMAFTDEALAALFAALPDAVAYCQMQYPTDVRAADFHYLYANQAFLDLSGFPVVAGQRYTALLPRGQAPDPILLSLLAEVARGGAAQTLQNYQASAEKFLSISAHSPKPDHFILLCRDVTEQHKAQHARLQAQAYAALILNSVGDGLFQTDEAGMVTFINPAGAALLGYQADEVIGRHGHTLFHHSHADGRVYPTEDCSARLTLRRTRGKSLDNDVFWRKDGSCFAVHFVSAPMVVDGRVRGAVLTFRDISEETQVRKTLLDNQTKIRKAQEIAGFGSYTTDLLTGQWESSPQLDALLGVGEDFVHDIPSLNMLLDEEFRQAAADHFEDVIAGKCDWRMDYRITRPSDGAKRWMAANGEIERDSQGKPVRLIGTIQDITARKQIEAELQESHDLLRKLSQEVPGALYRFTMHADGHFSAPFASQGVREMFGVEPTEVKDDASKIFAAIAPDQRAAFVASVMQSARSLENWVEVFQVQLPGGQRQWRQGQARPERLADGSVQWHGFISDATVRVESKAELLHLNETLESRVLERTRALVEALASAELAKRSRGQFLANMSHEIRTPMNSIMGMVYLALKTPLNPVQREYLQKIQRSGSHLLGIINDILDFSKIDAGKLQLESAPFDLRQLVQHIVHLTEGRSLEKGLSLRLELAPTLPHRVWGDSLRLGQILINFLNNASKFTERGGIVLRVHGLHDPVDDPGTCLLIFEVEDSGIGIHPEQRARLFQPFEQGDNSTTRKFGGSGLGLAISRQLALLMGGDVGISSAPGVGSVFWFIARFPIAQEALLPPSQAADVDGAMATLHGKRVLVADDNDFNLDVACGLLQEAGMRVEVVRNGAQAIEALLRAPFDCVLMDVQMPVMDGLEASRRIRSDPALANLKVLAMTANAGQEDRKLCLQAGMHEVLTKPIDPDHLYVTLARYLSNTAPAPAAHTVPAAAAPVLDRQSGWDDEALGRIVGHHPATHERLLAKFLSSARDCVSELQRCALNKQWVQASALAHKLKSSARSVGALRLAGLCEALELTGTSDDTSSCQTLVDASVQAFAEADVRISAKLQATAPQ
jgi:PAS domain S-box-containing protein